MRLRQKMFVNIMPQTSNNIFLEHDLSLQCILNAFVEPVFICEKNTNVLFLNYSAEKLLHKLGLEDCCGQLNLAACLPIDEIKFKNLINLALAQSGVIPSKVAIREPGKKKDTLYSIHCANVRNQNSRTPRHILIRLSPKESNLDFRFRDLKNHAAKLRLHLKQQHQLAYTDSLTEMANRRHFKTLAEQGLQDCIKNDVPCCVLMLDLDYFKAVNDSYGHDVGDTVLKAVGKLLNSVTRADDISARWGGEEFALFLTNTTKEKALTFAARIHEQVSTLSFSVGEETFGITLSIGGSQAKRDDSFDSLMKRSDEALYTSKLAGRNQSSFK